MTLPTREPRLTVLRDQQVLSTKYLSLGDELVVGRSPQSQIVLSIGSVSRMHARFFHDEFGVHLEDLGSANGTYVDGQKIEGVVQLRSGQLIRLGQSRSTAPTILRIDLDPSSPDVGRTRPVTALSEGAERPESTPRNGSDDETTADELTLPTPPTPQEQLAPSVPLRTRPVQIPQTAGPVRAGLGRGPTTLWIGLACLALFVLLALWRSCGDDDPWREVELAPTQLEAGRAITISGMPEGFEFGFDLRVGDAEVEDLEVAGTEGRGTVPDLPDLTPGDHEIDVVGYADDEAVFRRVLPYRKAPAIDHIQPAAGHLGELVTLTGVSLGNEDNPPRLHLGSQVIGMESHSSDRITFRIPVVEGSVPADLPVRVSIGGLDALAPSPLAVLSNEFSPIELPLTARPQAEEGLWEIASPLGPVAYVHTTAGESGDPPPNVQDTLAGMTRLFAAFRDDASRVVVRSEGRNYQFGFFGEDPETIEPLFSLSAADLDEAIRDQETRTSTAIRAQWLARALTQVAATLGRGVEPTGEPTDAPYLAALSHLIASNLDRGGAGRPGAPDLERLEIGERQGLGRAFVAIPPSLEPVGGRWIGQLENVFDSGSGDRVEVVLDLSQSGNRVSGTAQVSFRSGTGSRGFPEAPVSGTVTRDVPREVRLRLSLNRPLGNLELVGAVGGEGMMGSFRSDLAPEGDWRASRHGGVPAQRVSDGR